MDSERVDNSENINTNTMSMMASEKRGKKPCNKLLPVVIILAILAVAGAGFGVWGVVNEAIQRKQIEELETEIAGKNEEIAALRGVTVEEVENEETKGEQTTLARSTNVPFARGKQIIPEGGFKSARWSVTDETLSGLSVDFIQDSDQVDADYEQATGEKDPKDEIRITYTPAKVNEDFGLNLAGGDRARELKVENIDVDKVVDVKIGLFGQAPNDKTVLLYLMEDGNGDVSRRTGEGKFAAAEAKERANYTCIFAGRDYRELFSGECSAGLLVEFAAGASASGTAVAPDSLCADW